VVKGLNIIVTSTTVQWVCTYKSPKENTKLVIATVALASDVISVVFLKVLAAVKSYNEWIIACVHNDFSRTQINQFIIMER